MSLKIYLPIRIAAIAVQGIMKNRYLSVDSVIVFILTEIATTLRTKKTVIMMNRSIKSKFLPKYLSPSRAFFENFLNHSSFLNRKQRGMDRAMMITIAATI